MPGKPDFLIEEERPVDLRQFFFRYIVQYWYWYLIGLVLGLTGAWLYLRYAEPVYLAKATILIKDESANSGVTQESLFQGLGISQSAKNVLNEIHILKSRTLMEEVVDELGLEVNFIHLGRVKDSEAYKKVPLQVIRKGSPKVSGSVIIKPVDERQFEMIVEDSTTVFAYNIPVIIENDTVIFKRNSKYKFNVPLKVNFRKREDVAAAYAAKIKIAEAQEWSSVLSISLKDVVPERAKDVVNTLVKVYNRAALEDKNEVGSKYA
jgi:tyrosine-protein kinase Etk/Wzc